MNKIYQKECESSCEYTLPDYMGDVKKVLCVSATAIPSNKFALDGEAEFSGIVSYSIMYSDTEGKLTNISLSSDYDMALAVDSSEYTDSYAVPKAVACSVRLTGPRKLVAKATVASLINVSCDESVSCEGTAFASGNTPQVLTKSVRVENAVFSNALEREYAEEAERLSGVMPDDIEIIATSGAARITESTVTDGGVLVKGELIITSIIRTDEQPPFAIRKTVPFEETVTLDGLMPDMQTVTDAYVTSVTAGVTEDADGSVVTFNAIAEFFSVACNNKTVDVTADAYLKECETEGKYEKFTYSELVTVGRTEENVTVSAMRSDVGCADVRDILTLAADVRGTECKLNGERVQVNGEAVVTGIACEINESGEPVYIPVKFSSPVSFDVNLDVHIPDGASAFVSVASVNVTPMLEAERISAKCLLKVDYRVEKGATVECMTECNETGGERFSANASRVTVYYPEKEETLFEIAKRFHTTCAKLADDNGIAEAALSSPDVPASLAGVKKLIIR